MLNVLVLGTDGILRTPPFKHILRGCTVRRCCSFPELDLNPPVTGSYGDIHIGHAGA